MPHLTLAAALSTIFLESEKQFGSRQCCFLAIDSLKEAIVYFKGTQKELHYELNMVAKTVIHMTPRIALLILIIFSIVEEYEKNRHTATSIDEEKKLLLDIIEAIECKRKKSSEKLLQYSDDVIVDGDTILIHDVSHTIFNILERANEQEKKFTILVAEQEEKQTRSIVDFLQKRSIPFTVIPEFLLTHAMDTITKAMLGAVTINSLHQIIADAGSEAIATQMHYFHIPVYVPITTDKFSLWQSEEKHYTFKTSKYKSSAGIEYNKMTFSHDRYPVSLVTHFITNKGILNVEELIALYDTYYEQTEHWRASIGV